jgi:hypothetical protein
MRKMWILVGVVAIASVLYSIEADGPMSVLRRSLLALSGIVLMATSLLLV